MHPLPSTHAPIGVFDSGVGGLSVLREIRQQLPGESLIYAADSGHAPYGNKPTAEVQARAEAMTDALRQQGCKALVVACNTVTGLSIQALRARHPDVPMVAIEPAVKPAAAMTRTGIIGVLATQNTVDSAGLARLIAQHAQGVTVITKACPGWVERIERGELDDVTTRAAVDAYVQPVVAAGADVLVLGCTHYPFLRASIQACAGPSVAVLDPAASVARELVRRLEAAHLTRAYRPGDPPGSMQWWTTGDPALAQRVMQGLWPEPIRVRALSEAVSCPPPSCGQ